MRRPRHIWLYIAAGLLAALYFAHSRLDPGAGSLLLAEKGACAALLALWAALNLRGGADRRLIVAVMAFGALGDVLIDAIGLSAGALAFLAGHVAAIILYLRHWRRDPTWVAASTVVAAFSAWAAFRGIAADGGLALYVFGLTLMTATAMISRFPHWVRLGALLFFASDWLIFLRIGPLQGSSVPDMLIWPLYAAGQMLIAWGVVTGLRREQMR